MSACARVKRECRISPLCHEIRHHKEFRSPVKARDLKPKIRVVKRFRDESPPKIPAPSVGYPHLPFAFKRMCETSYPSASSQPKWNLLNIPKRIPPTEDLPRPAHRFLKKRSSRLLPVSEPELPSMEERMSVDEALALYVKWKDFCEKVEQSTIAMMHPHAAGEHFLTSTQDLLEIVKDSELSVSQRKSLRNLFAEKMCSKGPLTEAHNAIHRIMFTEERRRSRKLNFQEDTFRAKIQFPENAFVSLPELCVKSEQALETQAVHSAYVPKIPFTLQELHRDTVPSISPVTSPKVPAASTQGDALKDAVQIGRGTDDNLELTEPAVQICPSKRKLAGMPPKKDKRSSKAKMTSVEVMPWRLTPVHLPDWMELYYIPLRKHNVPPGRSAQNLAVPRDRLDRTDFVESIASKMALAQSCHEFHKAPRCNMNQGAVVYDDYSREHDDMLESFSYSQCDLSQFGPEFAVRTNGTKGAIMSKLDSLFKDNEEIGVQRVYRDPVPLLTPLQILDEK